MVDKAFHTTLAYTKSPKTSRRTTFQDELEAAVSARTSRHKTVESNSYSDDFDEDDDDDILSDLLKTRRKKMDIFKAGRTKAKVNDFKLSDDEEENVKPKKVSFVKTNRRSSPVHEEQLDSGKSGRSDTVGSSDSQGSFHSYQGRNNPQSARESLTPERGQQDPSLSFQSESSGAWKSQSESFFLRKSLSESPLPLNSENSQWNGSLLDSPLPLPSQRSQAGSVEDKPPRPRPRQRAAQLNNDHDEEDRLAGSLSSRAATSSVSIPLSFTDGPTTTTGSSPQLDPERMGSSGSDNIQHTEEHHTLSSTLTHSRSEDFIRSLEGTESSDFLILNQNKGDRHATSFKEHQHEASEYASRASRQSQTTVKSQDRPQSSRSVSSRRSKSACSYAAESKYLGTLKILDQKLALNGTQPDAADSLRAAVYQDWLKKKEEKLQENLKLKKQEENLKKEKKTEEEMNKKAEAKASYEAWKEKKHETIKEKLREKQEALRKQQKEQDEKEEKKETAKRVFEKWKQEHDDQLREQHRKKTLAENRLKQKNEKEQEERKKESKSSFSQWSESKKVALLEKVKEEQKKEKIKNIEEQYQKEEKEKEALEVYEKWLKRKEFQQKREKREKKIKAIVPEDPPPAWSPPNRTIPFVLRKTCIHFMMNGPVEMLQNDWNNIFLH
ncbi:microtubule-associated protein 9 isoform X2 [Hoplias malabaricus]|uniref:microtubule-associated protein 9 isoform X2 n=1 Tax=Hoplias malabaricus TaxID=27720 RepID=UPI003462EAFE